MMQPVGSSLSRIEACSPGPRLELFARGERKGWTAWGEQAKDYEIGWETYAYNSRVAAGAGEWVEAVECEGSG